MKRCVIFVSLIFLGLQISGQVNRFGVPLIKSYSSEIIHGSDYTHSITKDKLGNIYLANEDMGIIRYDGNVWRTIPVRNNQLIRALGVDRQGTIYAGGKFEFGYLEPDKYGRMNYVSLSERIEMPAVNSSGVSDSSSTDGATEKIDIGEIISLVVKDSNVYFVSSDALFDYDIVNDSLSWVRLSDYDLKNVLKVFRIEDKIIFGDNTSGLYEYKNGKIEMLPGSDFFKRTRCMLMMPYDENRAIVATFEVGLYLYNFKTGEVSADFIDPSLQKMFTEYRIYSGTDLPSDEFALGTIQGGVFIINKDGELVKHWDTDNSDLKDNGGVLAIYCDPNNNSELWISTAGYINKVYINLPFTEFSPKSGINGGVNNICEMNGDIYVSTDLGVYRSKTNDEGHIEFAKIPEIIDQVFPVFHAQVGEEEFILVGSINGIFQITSSGKVIRIAGNVLHRDEFDKKLDINVRIIEQSKLLPQRFYIGTNAEGVRVIEYNSGKWRTVRNYRIGQGSIVGIKEVDNGDLIFASDFSNSIFRVAKNDTIAVRYGVNKGISESSISSLSLVDGKIVLASGEGLFRYVEESDTWVSFNEITGGFSSGKASDLVMLDKDKDFWYSFKDTRYSEMLFRNQGENIQSYYGSLALLPNVKLIDIKNIDNKIWIALSNSVFVIDKERLIADEKPLKPMLAKIVAGRDSVIMDESFSIIGEWGKRIPVAEWMGDRSPEFKFNLNSVSFFWSTPYFINEESTVYSYKLEGFDSDWSPMERVVYKDYTNLPFGHYSFRVKAITATDIESQEAVYQFVILKPWYLTAVMILVYIIIVIVVIFAIIKAYTRKLKNENIRLEGIVAERTAVVVKQKEELESSIHYASRIQMALLPSEEILSENIKNYFVLFKPRDIVSGDFYWMTKKGKRLYIVAADCTGHGVPGAFMSLLGMSFLDEIIDKEFAPSASTILKELRLHVTESLKQVGGDDEAKDGMDMALLVIDFNTQLIEFSGAYNPCFKVRKLTPAEVKNYSEDPSDLPEGAMSNGKYLLETIYASKMPIGISSRMDEEYIYHEWALKKGISYYLFSDGYVDQFGGPSGRKFMKKNFKRLLLDIQEYPMSKQKELLNKNLIEWMGESPQIDDILVMGIRTD